MSSSDRWRILVLVSLFLSLGSGARTAGAQTGANDIERVTRGCDLYYAVRFEEAITELEALLAEGNLTGDNLQSARVCLARAHVKAGNVARARTLFQQILTEDPQWRADPVVFPPDEYSVYEWVVREMGLDRGPSPPTPSGARSEPETPAPSQPSRHRFGLIGGFNLANFGGDTETYGRALVDELTDEGSLGTVDVGSRALMMVAAYYAFQVNPRFALRLEAAYVQRGAEYTFTPIVEGFPVSASWSHSYNYVEVSPQAEVHLGSGRVIPLLLGGVLVGFNTKAEEEVSLLGFDVLDVDSSDFVSSSYVGFLVGGGIAMELSPVLDLQLQVRFVRGITGLFADPWDELFKIVPSDLAILGGVSFRPGS